MCRPSLLPITIVGHDLLLAPAPGSSCSVWTPASAVTQFFGATVVDNTDRYSIAFTTILASGPASWTGNEPPELSVSRPTSTTRTTAGR
jgi:hypothetical protein